MSEIRSWATGGIVQSAGHYDHAHWDTRGQVQIEQTRDFATNTIRLRAVVDGEVVAGINITAEHAVRMTTQEQDRLIANLMAQASKLSQPSVPTTTSAPIDVAQANQDLPGGLHNWPVVIMADGDRLGFEHPDMPGERFELVFDFLRDRQMHAHVEWQGHGRLNLRPVIAVNVLVRDLVAEAMALITVARSIRTPVQTTATESAQEGAQEPPGRPQVPGRS